MFSREKIMSATEKKFVTRREGVELARAAGIPLTLSRTHKDHMNGCGPHPAGRYGAAYLYVPSEFLRYAEERVRQAVEPAA
jgi:hypothetical protein